MKLISADTVCHDLINKMQELHDNAQANAPEKLTSAYIDVVVDSVLWEVVKIVESIPTVDAVPIDRPVARWIPSFPDAAPRCVSWRCSNCTRLSNAWRHKLPDEVGYEMVLPEICPYCGARMEDFKKRIV